MNCNIHRKARKAREEKTRNSFACFARFAVDLVFGVTR
jgi:hypothetical protein